MAVALDLVQSELDALGVEHSAGLEKQERMAVVEMQTGSAAAEVVAVGWGFYQFVYSVAFLEQEQEYVLAAADVELGH